MGVQDVPLLLDLARGLVIVLADGNERVGRCPAGRRVSNLGLPLSIAPLLVRVGDRGDYMLISLLTKTASNIPPTCESAGCSYPATAAEL
jgi:hypothetical protein